MNTNLPLHKSVVGLPNIDLIERSEQAFSDAFLKATQILYRYLKQLNSSLRVTKDFAKEPFNLAILGLFSKMCGHYYSYILLETNHDRIGSQFLIEHLSETAITLTYLLEEVDKSVFSEYIFASVHQAHYLLLDVDEQLQDFSNHPDLLLLKDKLETFIAEHQEDSTKPETDLWGPQEANTTVKRGAIIGLNFLTNPSRQIALKIKPASWLDLQLGYLNSFTKNSHTKTQLGTNFTYLRDASHLCLHTTQAFLEEVSNHQDVKLPEIEGQQQLLNLLYEWFYNAHNAYQLRCCVRNIR